MAQRIDPVQKLKDQIIKLPQAAQDKLFYWLEAVRDVNKENNRRQTAPAKEETKS